MDDSTEASVQINATKEQVWHALSTPDLVGQWFFGAHIDTDWQKGSAIEFTGEWEGEKYVDRGIILDIQPNELLCYTHLSSRLGLPDVPENYSIVTFTLSGSGNNSICTIVETELPSATAKQASLTIWPMVLESLKQFVQQS